MCGELIEKKLDEILIGPYVGLSFPDKPLCEPTRHEIDRAIRERDFEKRSYQNPEIFDEWNRGGPTPKEYNRREQQYPARRIADLVVNGWREPPILHKDGRSVHDGLHRIKAARHRGDKTIKVQILCENPSGCHAE
jgi:hypothetical protein